MLRLVCLLAITAYAAGLKVQSCDNRNIVTFNKINVSPHPIIFPGKLNVDIDVTLNSQLGGNVDIALTLKKKVVFVSVPISCTDGIGSCTYKNVCGMLAGQKCPSSIAGQDIPCSCPFKAGRYTFKMDNIKVPAIPSSISWLASGEYEVEARLIQNGAQIGCLKTTVELGQPCTGWFCRK